MPKWVDKVASAFGYTGKAAAEAELAAVTQYYGRSDSYGPPQFRGGLKVSYGQLKQFADNCDVVTAAISRRTAMLTATPLLFQPVPGCTEEEVKAEVEQAEEFVSEVGGLGGPGVSWEEFLEMTCYDLLVKGCNALYRRPNKGGGTFSVEPLDSATIKPLRTEGGWVPQPPEPAYEQWINGRKVGEFTADEIRYLRLQARTDTRWGRSPTETALVAILQFMGYDSWNLAWITDGDGELGHWEGPPDATPDERRNFEQLIIKLNKSMKERQRGPRISMPYGFKWVPRRVRAEAEFEKSQTFMVKRIAMAFDINASVLGFAGEQYKVSQGDQLASAKEAGGTVFKLRLGRLLTSILHDDLGLKRIRAVWEDDKDDQLKVARALQAAGTRYVCLNDAHEMMGLPPAEGPLADAYYDMTPSGPIVIAYRGGKTPDVPYEQPASAAAQPTDPAQSGSAEPAPAPAATPGPTVTPAAKADLARWQRKALKYLGEGHLEKCSFTSDEIPPPIASQIEMSLKQARDAAQVRAAFAFPPPQHPEAAVDLPRLAGDLEQLLTAVQCERGSREGF
jgi:hypothetical protein